MTLITMVLGFLTICLGITLLQMSKVDPTTLVKLDRKSTMLFEASQHPIEEAEKGEVTALENPGMDALRGGFGAVGSIIRARSVSRRLSSASSFQSKRNYSYDANENLSTHGLDRLQRYQRESLCCVRHSDLTYRLFSARRADALGCDGPDLVAFGQESDLGSGRVQLRLSVPHAKVKITSQGVFLFVLDCWT